MSFDDDRKKSAFKAYLKYVIRYEKSARADEAGDEQNLLLTEVFIDFTLKLLEISRKLDSIDQFKKTIQMSELMAFDASSYHPNDCPQVRASSVLFFLDYERILLLGGPGLGKSTLTQFLSLYQAARLIEPTLAKELAKRLKLPKEITAKTLDSYITVRFPFRIELRRYATWMSEKENSDRPYEIEIARYIADILINKNTSSSLTMNDIFGLAATDPILLVLDGLDEVPNQETRQKIVENLTIFVDRIEAENGNLQIIMSSRPNGYSGEFNGFDPCKWEVNELQRSEFDEYCEKWLNQRIHSEEERCEAKGRIEAAMVSVSVQNLAKSLLQATVILTIVQRKIQIPHQKNSLYETYVKVIFAREKGKNNLIVQKWENQLLSLHERVGYELHRKMEQKTEALKLEEFSYYIYKVLEDFPGTYLGEQTLKEIAQEILQSATDRLCLLFGKGENQTEIDFVVQQFREYFAASYLTKHPDAQPDKIFLVLSRRGAYWSYVLQFYFAQAEASQQRSWLDQVEEINDVLEKTRACNSILNTLPELKSKRLKDLERALNIIFDNIIRWAWLGNQTILETLEVVQSGASLSILWKWLYSLSVEDQQTLEAELWLLGQVFSLEQKEEQLTLTLFENKVQELLENENTRDNALISALENDLKIDLSAFNILEISPTLLKFYHESNLSFNKKTESLNNFIQSQNITKLCELMFYIPVWEFTQIPLPFFTQQELLSIVFESDDRKNLPIFEGYTRLSLEYYLIQKNLTLRQPLPEEEEDTQNIYFIHFQNLLNAALNPCNYELDRKARESDKRIPGSKLWEWGIDRILGPDLSAFNSIEEWKCFKKEIVDISTQDQDWIANSANFNSISNLWSILFFHPRHWPLLVKEGLITNAEHQTLLDSKLANLLNIPKIPINLFNVRVVRTSQGKQPVIPLSKILNIAINIAIRDGIKYIGNAEGLYSILWRCQIESVTPKDANDLLKKSKKLNSLPSVWAGAIFYLCINSPSLNLDLFLEFWEINQDMMIHKIPDFDQTLNKNDLLEQLLAKNQKNALTLAAFLITKRININQSTQDKLHDQLLKGFNNNNFNDNNDPMRLYLALLKLTPKIEDFSVWHCQEIVNKIAKSVSSLDKLCQRFLNLSNPNNSGFVLDYKLLREALMVFITNRKNYPSALVLSALETILKIDEANLPPLQDQDWQRSDD